MTVLSASQTRIPTETFNQVVYNGERIEVRRRDGQSIFLISKEDLDYLEELEDEIDAIEAQKALKEFEESGSEGIPHEEIVKMVFGR
jgi:hypothetical protein